MRSALVTVVLGDSFKRLAEMTYPSICSYARKIGADPIIISEQKISKHPHYEKLIIGELLSEYDRLILLDADVIVREDCPDLFKMVPPQKLGMYDEGLLTTDAEKWIHRQTMVQAFEQHGDNKKPWNGHFWNTGVIVASREHREIFVPPKIETEFNYWDQSYINVRIHELCPDMFDIGYKFNRMNYVDPKVKEHRLHSYIVHYAGVLDTSVIRRDVLTWEMTVKSRLILLGEAR